MTENEISAVVVDVCYKVHVKLGPGLLESVYEAIINKKRIVSGKTKSIARYLG